MIYKFQYSKTGRFYKCVKVIGHSYIERLDRMTLLLENGGIQEISRWSYYDCKLGPDWALAVKKDMEKKAGQAVVVDRNLDAQ